MQDLLPSKTAPPPRLPEATEVEQGLPASRRCTVSLGFSPRCIWAYILVLPLTSWVIMDRSLDLCDQMLHLRKGDHNTLQDCAGSNGCKALSTVTNGTWKALRRHSLLFFTPPRDRGRGPPGPHAGTAFVPLGHL